MSILPPSLPLLSLFNNHQTKQKVYRDTTSFVTGNVIGGKAYGIEDNLPMKFLGRVIEDFLLLAENESPGRLKSFQLQNCSPQIMYVTGGGLMWLRIIGNV